MHSLTTLVMALILAVGLASCGRKGPLEAPDGSAAGKQEATTSDAETADGKPAEKSKKEKPDQPFILDFLL
jgi:predicted small lipoprotein YifL